MNTAYYFDLLGECSDMPLAEAKRCIEAECGSFRFIKSGPGYLIAEFPEECLGPISDRISLTHCIGRYLGEYNPGDLSNLKSASLPEGTFAIKGKRFKGLMADADSQSMIRKIGGVFSEKHDVNLKDPDTVIRMHMSDSVNLFIEEAAIDKDLLEKRKVGERPFFSPISLHPKYARALINLTGVPKGGTVLDPFCGTGGIVIEAAAMGMKAIASDFDEEMVIGCRENMEFYGLKLERFETADIGEIPELFSDVDAVATDPPYGRSTKTGGENVECIYKRALDVFPEILSPGARAGVVLPHVLRSGSMNLESVHEQFVHGSLSRYYHVFGPVAN